jgi:hypothetical protein
MELVRFHYGTITSTNDFAKELLLQHNFVLVTAIIKLKDVGGTRISGKEVTA